MIVHKACPHCGTIQILNKNQSHYCSGCLQQGHVYPMLAAKEMKASAEYCLRNGFALIAVRRFNYAKQLIIEKGRPE